MTIINSRQKIIHLAIISTLAVIVSACSDNNAPTNKPEKTTPPANHAKHTLSTPGEATDSVKQKFINEFSNRCISRELKNSNNPDVEKKRFADSCSCIANHIAENLADVDAEKYLQAHEDTQALDIKFDQAAYFCLQAKTLPKGPHLFGKE
jgi:hypothetical protein